MKKNLGKSDRIIRGVIAVLLLVGAAITNSLWLFLASLFVFFEAFMSWCIFYQLIGKSTCPIKKRVTKKRKN